MKGNEIIVKKNLFIKFVRKIRLILPPLMAFSLSLSLSLSLPFYQPNVSI
nr:hypothetical protein [Candidatus Cardinium sp. cBcalN1]